MKYGSLLVGERNPVNHQLGSASNHIIFAQNFRQCLAYLFKPIQGV